MAFIIRSNGVLANPANAAGNIHAYYAVQDYRAMLDFSHGIYRVDGQRVPFDEVATFTRGGGDAQYHDLLGRNRTVPGSAPRFHYMPTRRESGLLLEQSAKNYLTADANGSTFSAEDSAADLSVSWWGSGTVEPVASGLTLRSTKASAGRTTRFYERTGAKSGTISVAGEASEIMITNANLVHTYVKHGETRLDDAFFLAGVPLSILQSGTGTILLRIAFVPDNGDIFTNRSVIMRLENTAAPNGMIEIVSGYPNGLGSGEVKVQPNGSAINTGVVVARNTGNKTSLAIVGIYYSGFGASAGAISHGQAGSDTAASAGATPPTAITQVRVNPPGGVLTHCIVYDRMVSNDEAFDLAVFGS